MEALPKYITNHVRFVDTLRLHAKQTGKTLVPLSAVKATLMLPESTMRGIVKRLLDRKQIRKVVSADGVEVGVHPHASLTKKKASRPKPKNVPEAADLPDLVVHNGKDFQPLRELIGQVSSAHSALKAIRIVLKLNLLDEKKRIATSLGIINSTL